MKPRSRLQTDADEIGYKAAARLFLLQCRFNPDRLLLPSKEEAIGINLLDRDDELTSLISKSEKKGFTSGEEN